MMYEAIKKFAEQFLYEPTIENVEKLPEVSSFVVVGMGGSGHTADIIKGENPALDLVLHRDYGLPELPNSKLQQSLVIASSYSGNTEETIDAFETAHAKNLPVIAVSTGGKLLELAQKYTTPFIRLPNVGIPPRLSLGFQAKALYKIIGDSAKLEQLTRVSSTLKPVEYESAGKLIAGKLKNKIPIVYTSRRNGALGNVWKINFNETGKVPALANIFPELNHNEMNAFGKEPEEMSQLSESFYFIMLKDTEDSPKVQRRMEITKQLYENLGRSVEIIELDGPSSFHKIFSSVVCSYWVAYFLAKSYGIDPEQIPIIEEFKKLI